MITLTHELPVPLHIAWRAWATSAHLTAWDPDRVEGDFTAGQELVMHWDSLGASLHLRVQENRFEEELVLRALQEDGTFQDLRVELRALTDQVTAITLTLTGEMSDDQRQGSAAGWHTQLRILERYLSLDPKPRTSYAAFGTVVLPLARVYDALSHPGQWLCGEDVYLKQEGQAYAMTTLPAGQGPRQSLSGDVISLVEGRELALWCRELGGIIRMRAIPLADGRARLIGVAVVRWGEEPAAIAVQDALRAGVDRLIASIGGPSGTA